MPNHHLQGARRGQLSDRQYPGRPPPIALITGLGKAPHIVREPLEDHQKQRLLSVYP